MARHDIQLRVNGAEYKVNVESRLLLVHLLRENLRLTGTHIGCDTTHCGACTVLLDGEPVKSCTVLAVQADGADIGTVEGLEQNGKLHPIQEAFWENHGLQCGYCTPGMMMTGCALLARDKEPRRSGHPRGDQRQSLPLHRVLEHRQSHPGGSRAAAEAVGGIP